MDRQNVRKTFLRSVGRRAFSRYEPVATLFKLETDQDRPVGLRH